MGIKIQDYHPKTHLATNIYQQSDGTWKLPDGTSVDEKDLYGKSDTRNEAISFIIIISILLLIMLGGLYVCTQ